MELWYPGAGGSSRRGEIQRLRAALDGYLALAPVSVGLCGLGVSDVEVQELTADLATSIAAAGHRVLLVDACFDGPSQLPEYGNERPDLADILAFGSGPEDVRSQVKQALSGRAEVVPGLVALRAGTGVTDPVDAMAGRQFRQLLDVARDYFDFTMVAAPGWGDPTSGALAQRLDHIVLVGRIRATSAGALEAAKAEFDGWSASLPGVVLLKGRRSREYGGWLRRTPRARSRRRSRTSVADDSMSDGVEHSLDQGSDEGDAWESAMGSQYTPSPPAFAPPETNRDQDHEDEPPVLSQIPTQPPAVHDLAETDRDQEPEDEPPTEPDQRTSIEPGATDHSPSDQDEPGATGAVDLPPSRQAADQLDPQRGDVTGIDSAELPKAVDEPPLVDELLSREPIKAALRNGAPVEHDAAAALTRSATFDLTGSTGAAPEDDEDPSPSGRFAAGGAAALAMAAGWEAQPEAELTDGAFPGSPAPEVPDPSLVSPAEPDAKPTTTAMAPRPAIPAHRKTWRDSTDSALSTESVAKLTLTSVPPKHSLRRPLLVVVAVALAALVIAALWLPGVADGLIL